AIGYLIFTLRISSKNIELHPYNDKVPGDIYIIFIQNPQNGNKKILDKDQSYWQERYQPVQTFSNNGRVVTTIYRLSSADWQKIVNQ
ncbi:hypothetical protein CEN42_05725, partial [Fischerella thermalis CCMEE 5208]